MSNELLHRLRRAADDGRLPSGVGPADMLVMRVLADSASDASHRCTLKQSTIARWTLLSVSTIGRSLHRWQNAGWLQKRQLHRADGGKSACEFTLSVPQSGAAADGAQETNNHARGRSTRRPGGPASTARNPSHQKQRRPGVSLTDQEPLNKPNIEPGAVPGAAKPLNANAVRGDGPGADMDHGQRAETRAWETAVKASLLREVREDTWLAWCEPASLRFHAGTWFWVTRTGQAQDWTSRNVWTALQRAFREVAGTSETLVLICQQDFEAAGSHRPKD